MLKISAVYLKNWWIPSFIYLRISYLVSPFHFLLTNFQKFFSIIRKLFSHSKSEQFSKQNTIYFMESFFTKPVLRRNQYIINLAGTIWFHSIPNESFEKFWSFLESYKEKAFKIISKDIKIILTTFIELYLVQLIEHPILRIPNILFVYLLSIFSR